MAIFIQESVFQNIFCKMAIYARFIVLNSWKYKRWATISAGKQAKNSVAGLVAGKYFLQ